MSESAVLAYVRDSLGRGVGGRIVAPTVDMLSRVHRDAAVRGYLDDATVLVAGSHAVVLASRLAGRPLPGRVPSARLARSLAAELAGEGRSVFLIAGGTDRAGVGTAERAALRLARDLPGLRIAGCLTPPPGLGHGARQVEVIRAAVCDSRPDLVLVGLGTDSQEWLISRLRPRLPGTWFLGCGGAIAALAGARFRAGRRGALCRDLGYLAHLYADALRARGRARGRSYVASG